jgi:sporulation protein YlmC with PRC-barrel domain
MYGSLPLVSLPDYTEIPHGISGIANGVNVKRGKMRIKYWFASCLLFITTLSLSACAYPDLTPIVTPTAIALYQDDDFAVAPAPLIDPADTPVAEPPPIVAPAETSLPVETPVAEAPPVVGPAETPLLAETPAAEAPPVVADVATPVTEETPDVEVPLILGETEIPGAEDTPVAETPLVVETPVLEPTPALTPVVTPVVEETPAVQPPLIVGETAIPAPEDTPVAETPIAVTPAVTPLPVETPIIEATPVEPTPVEPTPTPDVQVVPPLTARALVEASTLRGRTVRNVERPGQPTVDHVVADLGTRQILFATIRYGALLRLADRRVPVPPEYLHWDPQDRRLLVTLPEGAIANMRSYDNRWPDLSDPGWTQDVQESWQPLDPSLVLHPPVAAVKANTVTGERVVGAGGTELAQVSDLLLNLESNQIEYIVLRMSGGFLGLGREYRAVPAELFEIHTIDREEGEITLLLDVQESTLRAAPAYDADLIQNGDATWELDNRRYWEMTPQRQQTAAGN